MERMDEVLAVYWRLPAAARRLLAEEAKGPGWWCRRYDIGGLDCDELTSAAEGFRENIDGSDWFWIPASETETLRAWAEVSAYYAGPSYFLKVLRHVEWKDDMRVGVSTRDGLWEAEHDGTYAGRLIAAAKACPIAAFSDEVQHGA